MRFKLSELSIVQMVNCGIIFWGDTRSVLKEFETQKKILGTMLGISSRMSRRKCLKMGDFICTNIYIYSLKLFVVDKVHCFQTDSSVREVNTRYNN